MKKGKKGGQARFFFVFSRRDRRMLKSISLLQKSISLMLIEYKPIAKKHQPNAQKEKPIAHGPPFTVPDLVSPFFLFSFSRRFL
jgi:hypothetical protein